jgi:hypothetical protein
LAGKEPTESVICFATNPPLEYPPQVLVFIPFTTKVSGSTIDTVKKRPSVWFEKVGFGAKKLPGIEWNETASPLISPWPTAVTVGFGSFENDDTAVNVGGVGKTH